jgi:molybdenum cofactor cytidylyltransferase
MKQIVGILLAAGSSQRFGADKRLHPMSDGTPMALASARHLAEICSRSIVVIRPGDTTLANLLAAEGLETLVCNAAAQGMGHSLSHGIAASADADGWLLALADMPYIAPASYLAVLAALQNGASLARPTYQEKFGHPVGFSAKHLPELLALTGDQGGKAILDAHRNDLHLCQVEDPGILKDIDQPSQVIVTEGYPTPLLASALALSP